MDQIIFHVDVNSAFLSWEAVYRMQVLGSARDLRTIPSAVAGDIKMRSGIILAKSQPAKKYGIQTGELIGEALRKCPELELVPPHYHLYDRCSSAFLDILRRFSPRVEPYSIDEAYCDMTGTAVLYGAPVATAELIKDTICEELGFMVNIGVSDNKLLAKMASDFKKPGSVHTLFPDEIQEKMWHLPVSDLFYVGRAAAKKLYALGIRTIGELACADLSVLRHHLKKHGEIIYAFANGTDLSQVAEVLPPNKGYGNSMTTVSDVSDRMTAKLILLSLCETVCTRLRKDGVMASVISIDIVYFDFTRYSHQLTLEEPSSHTVRIYEAVVRLFDELWNGMPLRHLGVHTMKIKKEEGIRQANLFDTERSRKLECMDIAVDAIRKQYGSDSIMRAVFLNTPVYHMSGGISREKQHVDYRSVEL